VKPRQKTCKAEGCLIRFSPRTSLQKACGLECAIAISKQEESKRFKKRTRELQLKAREHDRKWHIKTCQAEFNKFIRSRDNDKACISCGTRADIKYDAGHYRSIGASPELRFEEDNCHKQCSKNCNTSRSGNIIEYRKYLVLRIGLERVEWIEGYHEPKKYTIDQLKVKITDYRQRNKALTRH